MERLLDDVGHRPSVEALAQVSLDDASHVVPILRKERLVQMELLDESLSK